MSAKSKKTSSDKQQYFTDEENMILVSFVEENRELLLCKEHGNDIVKSKTAKWKELAEQLNHERPGVKRDAKSVKKRWNNISQKARERRMLERDPPTGGGASLPPLPPFVERALEIIGEDANVVGVGDPFESGEPMPDDSLYNNIIEDQQQLDDQLEQSFEEEITADSSTLSTPVSVSTAKKRKIAETTTTSKANSSKAPAKKSFSDVVNEHHIEVMMLEKEKLKMETEVLALKKLKLEYEISFLKYDYERHPMNANVEVVENEVNPENE